MISQLARERRIVKKLSSGVLSPASSSRAMAVKHVDAKLSAKSRCLGCDELEADVLVGDQAWHHLCYLFWQGRSETVRERPDSGVTPERSRWVIVVRADRPEVYTTLRRNFGGSAWVDVVMDRRNAPDRRGALSPGSSRAPAVERRTSQRRSWSATSATSPPFRLAYQGDEFEVYEATAPLAGQCPQCTLLVTVELPRFTEPPARLELTVIHEVVEPSAVRHVVEVLSRSATGRVLFTSRLRARPLNAT